MEPERGICLARACYPFKLINTLKRHVRSSFLLLLDRRNGSGSIFMLFDGKGTPGQQFTFWLFQGNGDRRGKGPLFETHHVRAPPHLHCIANSLLCQSQPFLFSCLIRSLSPFTRIFTLQTPRTVKLMGSPVSSARTFSTGWADFETLKRSGRATLRQFHCSRCVACSSTRFTSSG